MRRDMRDDVFGLSALRVSPDTSPALASQRPSAPDGRSSFASELARASQARAALNANKRYVSPLKQNAASRSLATPPRTTLAKTTTSSSTLSSNRSTAAIVKRYAPAPARAAAPLQRPDSARPPTPSTPSAPMALDAYPHPNGDNGRGMHWVPTTHQSKSAVDRFVAEAQKMGVKWVTFLNDGATVGQNDYLVSKLVGAGIEPIMRLYSATLEPIQGDIEGMARHYVGMGVHYFQPYNEPNLSVEQPDGVPSVDRYLNTWIPAAQAIVRGGGLPGFGSLAPGGDMNDVDFLQRALDGLRSRGQLGLLDRGWLSMHNYTHNHPIQERADTDGFFKFRAYNHILRGTLGRDVPIIGTEGGTFIGEQEDPALPAVDAGTAVSMATQAYRYMRDQREPWNFAYSFWTIANEAGGGTDPRFAQQALFKPDGTASPIVTALQSLG
jgi:hypothetical protein